MLPQSRLVIDVQQNKSNPKKCWPNFKISWKSSIEVDVFDSKRNALSSSFSIDHDNENGFFNRKNWAKRHHRNFFQCRTVAHPPSRPIRRRSSLLCANRTPLVYAPRQRPYKTPDRNAARVIVAVLVVEERSRACGREKCGRVITSSGCCVLRASRVFCQFVSEQRRLYPGLDERSPRAHGRC